MVSDMERDFERLAAEASASERAHCLERLDGWAARLGKFPRNFHASAGLAEESDFIQATIPAGPSGIARKARSKAMERAR